MTYGPIHQSGQGSAVERRLRDARQSPVGRGHAPPFAKVRPVRTSSLPVSGGSGPSGPIGRNFRGYGPDDAQTPSGNGTSSSGTCERQWADHGCDRDPRVGRVSEYSEEAWLSRAERGARFKFMLTICLIACSTRSSPRSTVFLCPFENVLSAAV
jgi:hypothetical protein